jgi:hypothetical protein
MRMTEGQGRSLAPVAAFAAFSLVGAHGKLLAASLKSCQEDLPGLQHRFALNPSDHQLGARLGNCQLIVGGWLLKQPDWSTNDSASTLDAAVTTWKAVTAAVPTDQTWQFSLALAESNKGGVLLKQLERAAAVESYRDAEVILENLVNLPVDKMPFKVVTIQYELANVQKTIGDILSVGTDLNGAIASYQQARGTYHNLSDALPTHDSRQDVIDAKMDAIDSILDQLRERKRQAIKDAETLRAAQGLSIPAIAAGPPPGGITQEPPVAAVTSAVAGGPQGGTSVQAGAPEQGGARAHGSTSVQSGPAHVPPVADGGSDGGGKESKSGALFVMDVEYGANGKNLKYLHPDGTLETIVAGKGVTASAGLGLHFGRVGLFATGGKEWAYQFQSNSSSNSQSTSQSQNQGNSQGKLIESGFEGIVIKGMAYVDIPGHLRLSAGGVWEQKIKLVGGAFDPGYTRANGYKVGLAWRGWGVSYTTLKFQDVTKPFPVEGFTTHTTGITFTAMFK